jgi:hypothetical protein
LRGTPSWLIVAVILAIVGLGVYGYFTTPLPFGLSSVIRTPGGAASGGTPGQTAAVVAPGARSGVGQPLVLGALTAQVQGVQRGVDLSANGARGPAGSFALVLLALQNGGTQPITPHAGDFSLADERGRVYAVDQEATRAAAQNSRRRVAFEATVPPGGRLDTALAFEVASDAGSLTLRVSLGYGELELGR